jgi:predicted NAD/FAD-binding protein
MYRKLRVAVVGSGISGLSAAWLLARRHQVTLIEKDGRFGGHSNTVDVATPSGPVPVDTGFIVYNTPSYPNLCALLDHLGVRTAPTNMGFAVSCDGGRYEYSGDGLAGLFGQPSNLVRPSHLRMIADILRFFREAPRVLEGDGDEGLSLGAYLAREGYSQAFVEAHILPMAAAIWSTPSADVMAFPVRSFIRFFANHGLLQARNRPIWRTVVGGSREYVGRVLDDTDGVLVASDGARRIVRRGTGVEVITAKGRETYDACVLATHADEALALLDDEADGEEREILGAFRYQPNRAVLHRDPALLPQRRRIWAAWNYLAGGRGAARDLSVTYWMNRLQPLGPDAGDIFVTLNPAREIAPEHHIMETVYTHPMFDARTRAAQRQLWSLQGRQRTWFCGSYFGYGFHEDGLQAGLAVAEEIGGLARPWCVPEALSRICLPAERGFPIEMPVAAE